LKFSVIAVSRHGLRVCTGAEYWYDRKPTIQEPPVSPNNLNSPNTDRPYDAVIFDLLTALLDSWTLWNDVAGSDGAGLKWRKAYLVGTYDAGAYRPYEDIIRDAAAAAGIAPATAEALIARWPDLRPWDDVVSVLGELRRRGVKLGIATNSSNAMVEHALAAAGSFDAKPFEAVATAESAGFYKPRPEPYKLALKLLGTDPARTLFVAGSAADVPGATAVGMPVYWHNRAGLPAVDRVRSMRMERTLTPLLDMV
jgi:2-haloacid dehalogenase